VLAELDPQLPGHLLHARQRYLAGVVAEPEAPACQVKHGALDPGLPPQSFFQEVGAPVPAGLVEDLQGHAGFTHLAHDRPLRNRSGDTVDAGIHPESTAWFKGW
jgi:hypothetical protein